MNKKDIENAIFYSYLNELDHDFLEKCNFSRDETEMERKEIAKKSYNIDKCCKILR